ncbi:helix-turn-helix domain-containing protein [Micromonospora carbonacea]|uniref:helix-turn-helix domain-containing protein n=1 Tax=Micromonospora carbonacea TaxID=47853 RepID=UPI00372097DA
MSVHEVGVGQDSPDEIFRTRLRLRRRMMGWSQQRLTDEMAKRGYPWHQTTVAKVEAGERRLSLGEATVLARVLGSDLESMTTPVVRDTREQLRELRLRELEVLHQRMIDYHERMMSAEVDLASADDMVENAMAQRAAAAAKLHEAEREFVATRTAFKEVATSMGDYLVEVLETRILDEPLRTRVVEALMALERGRPGHHLSSSPPRSSKALRPTPSST